MKNILSRALFTGTFFVGVALLASPLVVSANIVSVSVGAQTPNPVLSGGSATYTIAVTSNSEASRATTISSVAGLPAGASFSSACVSLSQTGGIVPLTIATLATTPAGTSTLSLHVKMYSSATTCSGSVNDTQNTSALLVIKKATVASITNSASLGLVPIVVGQPYTVSVSINAPAAPTIQPTGTVTISDGSASCTTPDISGSGGISSGSCTLASVSPGTKTITASYSGDIDFDTASAAATHQVTMPTITVDSETTNNTMPVITGTTDDDFLNVSVAINGNTYTAVPDGGIWSVATTSDLLDGAYPVSASSTDGSGDTVTVNGSVTIDTASPTLMIDTPTTNAATITGETDAGAAVNVSFDSGSPSPAAVSDTIWSINIPALPDGLHTVSATATDALGNTANATATLTIDTTPPVIVLNGDAVVNLTVGDAYVEQGATATDAVDGSVAVTISGDAVNTAQAGTYHITYDAIDASGNHAAQVARTVVVTPQVIVQNNPPTITLLGANPLLLTVGDAFADPGAIAESGDGEEDLTSSIVVTGSVDTTTAGTYVLTYTIASGDEEASIDRTVTVSPVAATATVPPSSGGGGFRNSFPVPPTNGISSPVIVATVAVPPPADSSNNDQAIAPIIPHPPVRTPPAPVVSTLSPVSTSTLAATQTASVAGAFDSNFLNANTLEWLIPLLLLLLVILWLIIRRKQKI